MSLVSLFAGPQSSPVAERVACPQVDEHPFELDLPDGRRLSYMTCGAGDGPLVVVLDGPGSRGLARAAAGVAARLGVRLVAADRPGFGTSTQVAGDRLADWPSDHGALLDALGARRAGILAQSGGTPYALATAAALPERTIGVALVAPVGPLGEPAIRACSGAVLRRGALLGRRAPWLLRLALMAAGRQMRKDPQRTAANVVADLPPADATFLREPLNWAIHQHSLAEILAHPTAMTGEIARLTRPWNIDYDTISSPVALWSGDRDKVHPTAHARHLAELLHDAPVHVIPGAATFALSAHYADALTFATSHQA